MFTDDFVMIFKEIRKIIEEIQNQVLFSEILMNYVVNWYYSSLHIVHVLYVLTYREYHQ